MWAVLTLCLLSAFVLRGAERRSAWGRAPLAPTVAAKVQQALVPAQTSVRLGSRDLRQAGQPQIVETYGKLPLSFEANQGQTDRQAKFLSRGSGYALFLTGNEAVLSLRKPEARSQK